MARRPGVLPTQLYGELDRFGEGSIREALRRALECGELHTGRTFVELPSGHRREYAGGLYPQGARVPERRDRAADHVADVVKSVSARPGRSARDVADRLPGVEAHVARAAVKEALKRGAIGESTTRYTDRVGRHHARLGLYVAGAVVSPTRPDGSLPRDWARTWRRRLGLGRHELSRLLADELGMSAHTIAGWQDRGIPALRVAEAVDALARLPRPPHAAPGRARCAAARERLLELVDSTTEGTARRSLRPRLSVAVRPHFDVALAELLAAGELYERPVWVREDRTHLRLFRGPAPAEWSPGAPVGSEELSEILARAGVSSSQAAQLLGASRSDFSSWLSGGLAVPPGRRAQVRRLPAIAEALRAPAPPSPAPIPGPRLRRLRKASGLSQPAAARRVPVSQSVFSRWERSPDGVPVEFRQAVRDAIEATEAPARSSWARDLEAARRTAGLRQEDVGRLVGASGATISAWEADRATPSLERRAAVKRTLCGSWPSGAEVV